MASTLPLVYVVVWLWGPGRSATDSGRSRMIESASGGSRKKTTTMQPDEPWPKPGARSSSWKRGFPAPSDSRLAVAVYAAAIALVVISFLYSFWRIRLLDDYLVGNRTYVLERDARWEKHIKGQAEAVQEILRRLPPR